MKQEEIVMLVIAFLVGLFFNKLSGNVIEGLVYCEGDISQTGGVSKCEGWLIDHPGYITTRSPPEGTHVWADSCETTPAADQLCNYLVPQGLRDTLVECEGAENVTCGS